MEAIRANKNVINKVVKTTKCLNIICLIVFHFISIENICFIGMSHLTDPPCLVQFTSVLWIITTYSILKWIWCSTLSFSNEGRCTTLLLHNFSSWQLICSSNLPQKIKGGIVNTIYKFSLLIILNKNATQKYVTSAQNKHHL